MPFRFRPRYLGVLFVFLLTTSIAHAILQSGEVHVWEMQEIQLESSHDYINPYVDVTCWINLTGPDFTRRVYGFWDGGNTFRVRFVAPTPGTWSWTTGSNQIDDDGLNTGRGSLRAVAWTEVELAANTDGVYLRNAWEKFGHWAARGEISTADGAITTGKDMHDEQGNRPFAILPDRDGLADFDHLNPVYFRSLDRKMAHLSDEGFVPFLETIRRDNAPAWKAYFDFNESYARFVQYLISRYGAYNLIFSGIHLDWIPENYSLTEQEFNSALTYHHAKYGPLPFGQPYTALIDSTTYRRFGHGDDCPWLTMHTVGNKPRNHAIYAFIEESFNLPNPYPVANLEPYYTGWNHDINRPGGETPEPDSDRDNYFARAQMYGSVLSGGLAGHVHGTAAYDITSTGEPAGWRPHIWTALLYRSGSQMQHLRTFVLSTGTAYHDLKLANDQLTPRISTHAIIDGLDGWTFMMRTPNADLALLYFEHLAPQAVISGLQKSATYEWSWFNPRNGAWTAAITLKSAPDGNLTTPRFPTDTLATTNDWAARLTIVNRSLIPSLPGPAK